jgi:hypothetical protein
MQMHINPAFSDNRQHDVVRGTLQADKLRRGDLSKSSERTQAGKFGSEKRK